MTNILRDYAKCVYANKATLVGYASLTANVLLSMLEKHGIINLSLGAQSLESSLQITTVALLTVTRFGLDTLNSYYKTKKHISNNLNIDSLFELKFSRAYCNRVGVRLAVKEAGLEKTLE
jgi:hypothetical protein